MIESHISTVNGAISFLTSIRDIFRDKKYRKLGLRYMAIYASLNKIQYHNKQFVNYLRYSEIYPSNYIFSLALKEIIYIDKIINEIFEVIGSKTSNISIQSLLRSYNRRLYSTISQYLGVKYQRVYFWKEIHRQMADCINNVSTKINNAREYGDKPLSFTILQLNMPDVDIFSEEFRYLRFDYPFLQPKRIILNKAYIQSEIEKAEELIIEFEKLLDSYSEYISK